MTHIHEESTLSWSWGRIVAHLKADHGIDIPMAWTVGQAHDAHLKAHVSPAREEMPVPEIVPKENPQILADRLIAAMAGLDFDTQWAADNGIGSSARGLLREQYGKAAERLLAWAHRGGVLEIPEVRGLARDLEAEKAVVEDLEETNNRLRQENAELTKHKTALMERRDEALERLGEVAGERDRAIVAGRVLEQQRDAERKLANALSEQAKELEEACQQRRNYPRGLVGDTLNNLQGRTEAAEAALEEARQELGATRERLAKRTKLLDEGRSDLRDLITEMREDQDAGIPPNVGLLIEALERIQGGAVSTAQPIGIRCKGAHLGLATTREMLEELTTRIDLGHCGLDYRTVDAD